MKKLHIVAIIAIAAAIGVLISLNGEVTTYSHFQEAIDSQEQVKIAGTLVKNKTMDYKPGEYFSFYMKDEKNQEQRVVLLKEKPQDFEMSEQIVLTGKIKGKNFVATDILLKCPSKYKDQEIQLREEATSKS